MKTAALAVACTLAGVLIGVSMTPSPSAQLLDAERDAHICRVTLAVVTTQADAAFRQSRDILDWAIGPLPRDPHDLHATIVAHHGEN